MVIGVVFVFWGVFVFLVGVVVIVVFLIVFFVEFFFVSDWILEISLFFILEMFVDIVLLGLSI